MGKGLPDKAAFSFKVISKLPFDPNEDQRTAIHKLSDFVFSDEPNATFILRGYAGTGKTNLIAALTNALPEIKMKSVMLAPTGRAAKVMRSYSGKESFTVHRRIYHRSEQESGGMYFSLADNTATDTLFIVDEASMIGDGKDASLIRGNSLLQDLMSYVFSGENCKLLLCGDVAQLPPVGTELSPALEPKYLRANFHLKLFGAELKEVARQDENSGILYNATVIRTHLFSEQFTVPHLETSADVIRLGGEELEDALHASIREFGEENVMIITRSNKRAGLFNRSYRNRILFMEDDLCTGDRVMIVKNNYFWEPQYGEKNDFTANGDMAEIQRITKREEMYGFHFAECRIKLPDREPERYMDVKLITDALYSDFPSLTEEQYSLLYERVKEDVMDEPNDSVRAAYIRKSTYFNALQVKFCYAITCHKAQGGQWPVVFIDQGMLKMDEFDRSYCRWLYTALTRAEKKVYLLNFNDLFFK